MTRSWVWPAPSPRACSGIIGFVGLVVPHIARGLMGTAYGRLLPASALLGSTLMLGVDLLTRSVTVVSLPPGVIAAPLGTRCSYWCSRGRFGAGLPAGAIHARSR